jgi:Xaa-Pro dipeptidase
MNAKRKLDIPFPQEEYDRRLAAVQEEMGLRNIDVLLLFAPTNLFYLAAYHTIGITNYQCLLVPQNGTPVLVVRLLEKPVAEASSWLDEVFAYEDHEDPAGAVKRALEETGWISQRLAAEQTSPFLSAKQYMHLQDIVGKVFVDGSGMVEAVRVIKSPLELECYRSAAKCTETGLTALLEAIAEGKTENQVIAECYKGMVAAGSEFFSSSPILNSGEKSGIAHTTFKRRVLKRGDAMIIEIGGVWHRYSAPLMRTAVVGEVSDEIRRMYDACVEALEATMAAIKPGVRSEEVQAACQAVIDKRGYEPNFRKRVGYSVGVGFAPGWGEGHIMDIKHHDKRELKPGMVFHVVPALRKDWEFGVGVSETVAITDSGIEVLTNFSRDLFVRD